MTTKPFHITILLLLVTTFLYAQPDVSGTWEGFMGKRLFGGTNKQLLRIHIDQKGKEICGYTYDSVVGINNSHCMALFKGVFDKKEHLWVLTGTSFIENTDTHFLMRILLWYDPLLGRQKLRAEIRDKNDSVILNPQARKELLRQDDIFRQTSVVSMRELEEMDYDAEREYVDLKKIADGPGPMPPGILPCYTEAEKALAAGDIPKKERKNRRQKNEAFTEPPTRTDNLVVLPPVTAALLLPDSVITREQMLSRKRNVFSRIPVTEREITLSLYDNALIDKDTITVFYNGKLLVSHQLLSEKPITIHLQLDENAATNEVILFADNLGSIPPNTALVVVTAGNKRYELHSSASLEENAVLVFEYAPKE